MQDEDKTRQQLIDELAELRRRVAELEDAESERKRMKEALRESEEKYRNVVERANDGVVIIQDGMVEYVSPQLAEMWGVTVEEATDTAFTDHLHPDAVPATVDRYERRIAGEDVAPLYETVFLRKDGSQAYVELNAGLITYQGEPADLVIVRDITERKRAEERLERRATQARLIYQVSQHLSGELEWDVLLSTIVTSVRDAFDYRNVSLLLLDEEADRLRLESMAGAYVDMFPDDLSQAVGEGMIGYAAATGETQISSDVSADPHYVRRAMEETQSELAVPIKSGERVIGVLDIQEGELDAFDETDMEVMETLSTQVATAMENARLYEASRREVAERRQAEERLRAIFDANPDITCLTDTEGNILDANLTLLKVTELSLEEIRGRNLRDLFVGDDPEKIRQAMTRLRRGEEVRRLEMRARIGEGKIRDYEINAIPLERAGGGNTQCGSRHHQAQGGGSPQVQHGGQCVSRVPRPALLHKSLCRTSPGGV